MKKHRIVTISREFGSGGRTIGKKLAEELKIPCYEKYQFVYFLGIIT